MARAVPAVPSCARDARNVTDVQIANILIAVTLLAAFLISLLLTLPTRKRRK